MSDGLRDALEKLVEEWRWQGDMKPWQEGGGPDAYEGGLDDAAAKLRAALAAHPAEPVGVSDEAVESAVAAFRDAHAEGVIVGRHEKAIRAVLEAATPFMQPQVVASPRPVEELVGVLSDPNWGKVTGLAFRERVAEVARTLLVDVTDPDISIDGPDSLAFADALLAAGVFREPPTREQIEQALRKRLVASNFNDNLHEPMSTQTIDQWVDVLAGAVLALMGGAER